MSISLPQEKLDALKEKAQILSDRMSDNPDPATYVQLSRDYAELSPIVEKIKIFEDLRSELTDLNSMLDDKDADPELTEMARMEREDILERIETEGLELKVLLLPKDAADSKSAIVEIRAGTGGDEAALFAGDLYRMYQRYGEDRRWSIEIMNLSEGDAGGYKEVVMTLSGEGAFSRLKFESGVHRVQRVPETESSGRIHTSAATVAVLPEVEDIDIEVDEKDLKIDVFRASGAGGQHVNTTDSAVRITHLPTNTVVECQDERSQHKNKAKAMKILRARIYEEERMREQAARAAERKDQVGSGDRSERIRTYNFPQGRVTDHRINLTLYKLDKVLVGESLDELIDALITEDQAQRLAAFEDNG